MTLGYKEHFTDGTPTFFKEKILSAAQNQLFVDDYYLDKVDIILSEFKPKLHSIRNDEKDRWHEDLLVHHVYGNRTKLRDNFLISRCCSVQWITILDTARIVTDGEGNNSKSGRMQSIMVDGKILKDRQTEELAINDGFNSLEHFFTWFPLNYSGKIIHFTKLRY